MGRSQGWVMVVICIVMAKALTRWEVLMLVMLASSYHRCLRQRGALSRWTSLWYMRGYGRRGPLIEFISNISNDITKRYPRAKKPKGRGSVSLTQSDTSIKHSLQGGNNLDGKTSTSTSTKNSALTNWGDTRKQNSQWVSTGSSVGIRRLVPPHV